MYYHYSFFNFVLTYPLWLFQIEKFGINSVDVKEILLEMRRYRMGLIQTEEQLRFSYEAIIEGAKQLSNPPSNNEVCSLPESFFPHLH